MTNETKKIDWEKIWSFIKSRIFLVLIITVLIVFSASQCSRIHELRRQHTFDKQNEIALTDSLKFERKKTGELNVSIAAFIASEKELKELNKELWKKIKAQDGEILSLGTALIQLRQDSTTLRKYLEEKEKIIAKLLQVDSNTYVAPWSLTYKYDDKNFDVFAGSTYVGVSNKDPLELVHVDTELTSRLTQIDLTWGQKIEKDVLRVFIESKYPGFTVDQMSGVLIDPADWPDVFKPEKKHWFQGLGLGPSISAGYDLLHAKPSLTLGVSLHYNIYEW